MKIGITPFIAENVVPSNVTSLEVYNGNTKVCDIDVTKMQLTDVGTKLYSFGLISDMHIYKTEPYWGANSKFDNALTQFEKQGCVMCTHCGDFSWSGLFNYEDAVNMDAAQFEKYKEICDSHNIPVYGVCGNHESYVNPITDNVAELKTYTGTDLYYTVAQGNDLFIFVGQPRDIVPIGDDALQWVYETLEKNRNKRCFLFVHPFIASGNPLGVHDDGDIFTRWGEKKTVFENLLIHYKNITIFHGHSHVKFEYQAVDKTANYNSANGYRSIHVPSLGRPRDIVDGELSYTDSESYGYIVDVYENHIVLKGYDFIANDIVPIAQYCVDTALQMIPANTFTDSTGTITT